MNRVLFAVAFAASAITPVSAQAFETRLENGGGNPGSWFDVVAYDDGSATVFNQSLVFDTYGVTFASEVRTWDGTAWGATERIDGGYPTWNYKTVQNVFEHRIERTSDGILVAIVEGRYHGSIVPSTGLEYALFANTNDGSGWSGWTRITDVGTVGNPAITTDNAGNVWVAWKTSNNLYEGDVKLAAFDASAGTMGSEVVVGTARAVAGFDTVDVVHADTDDVWVTYAAPDGLNARSYDPDQDRLGQERTIVADVGWLQPSHSAVWSETLYVAHDVDGVDLYRLQGGTFQLERADVFDETNIETSTYIESDFADYPVLSARRDGRIVVSAARYYHYEDYLTGGDVDEQSVVVKELGENGWSAEQTAYVGDSWNNVGGAAATDDDRLWLVGSSWQNLFVVESAQ